jgi:hypothetical protein
MAGDDSMLPVKVEFGAKASLEIKGEIPKESMGGLVNALTDAIRPWTEARGLKADQIRLQREDVLLEIAQKARARLLVDCVEPKPLSTKLLIPFLEKASLEDKDVALRDAWASLLVSATKTERARHLTFVDILTRISSQELELLEQICFEYKNFPENYYPGGHAEENRRQIESNARMLVLRPNDGGLSHQAKEFRRGSKLDVRSVDASLCPQPRLAIFLLRSRKRRHSAVPVNRDITTRTIGRYCPYFASWSRGRDRLFQCNVIGH